MRRPLSPARLSLAILCAVLVSPAQSADSIRIGVIAPLSSPASVDMGKSIVGGARVFVQDINATGGVLGRKVELVIRDDQANPDTGASAARELVEKEKVAAVVGIANTGVVMQAAKVMQGARIPLIISASTGAVIGRSFMPPAIADSYVFRTSASDELQAAALLDEAVKRRQFNRIALLHDDSPYGVSGRESIQKAFSKYALEPLLVGSFKVGGNDHEALLGKLKASGAQAVILYGLATDAGEIVKRMDKQGIRMAVIGPWPLTQQSFLNTAGKSADGVRAVATFVENELSSSKGQFALSYRRLNDTATIPSAVAAAQTYDALRLLSLAMTQAASTDGPKVRDALENLKYPTTSTVTARYARPFTPQDHEAISQEMVVMTEIRHGKLEYAYKEDAANATLLRTKTGGR